MAYMETTNLPMMLACIFSGVSGIMLEVHLLAGPVEAGFAGAACCFFVATAVVLVERIEQMERLGVKFQKADADLKLEELRDKEAAARKNQVPPSLGSHTTRGGVRERERD
jgi:hypothetical protein